MPVLPGAEPFSSDGGPVGVLVCHGFTGSPQTVRPWAEALAAAGLTVSSPRLPGHGTSLDDLARTRWEDWFGTMDRAFDDLHMRCEQVFVMGISMGACLALRLAELRGSQVSGLVLVNPSLQSENRALRLLPVLRYAVPALKGISNDIKKPGSTELAYDRMSLHALHSLTRLWALTRKDLAQVTQPLLVFRSTEDHVVEPSNTTLLLAGISSTDVHERLLQDSFHVATLDNDAAQIFEGSLDFVRRHTTGTALAPAATDVRGNGLSATDYVPIIDLDPQLADALLEMLRDEGIAAYAKPVFDHRALAELPARVVDRPLDRLYADRAASGQARALVHNRLPELRRELQAGADRTPDQAPRDAAGPVGDREVGGSGRPAAETDDEVWAGIMAAFESSPDGPAPWPDSEELASPAKPRGDTDDADPAVSPLREDPDAAPEIANTDALGPSRSTEAEEHFVPPPPPPLPRPDRLTRASWIALIGAPILLFIAAMFGADLSGWPGLLLAGAFVGGFVTLVARMKDRPSPDDDPDNGAVV